MQKSLKKWGKMMGWKIVTNNKDNWGIFSSISDSIIFECDTEQELLKHIALEAVYDGKLKAIERLMTYPNRWTVNDQIMFNSNQEAVEVYYDWYKTINNDSKTYEEYYGKIDEKLEELLERVGENEES